MEAPPLPPKLKKPQPVIEAKPIKATVLQTVEPRDPASEIHNSNKRECYTIDSTESTTKNHVVKIRIDPGEAVRIEESKMAEEKTYPMTPCITINVTTNEKDEILDQGYYFSGYGGQISPNGSGSDDNLDSGTGSDLEQTPPPLPLKKKPSNNLGKTHENNNKTKGKNGVSVTIIQHNLVSNCGDVDWDDNESNLSCDSLNSSSEDGSAVDGNVLIKRGKDAFAFPKTLLKDIRDAKLAKNADPLNLVHLNNEKNSSITVTTAQEGKACLVDESTYELRELEKKKMKDESKSVSFCVDEMDTNKFFDFHLNENVIDSESVCVKPVKKDREETFAGYKDILCFNDGSTTIRSAKGTVRGVKNRVRAGIATFLQINTTGKNYKEKDAGKVVVYTTTMGIVRETYHSCMKVKQILRTLLVKFEERDLFMSGEYQAEIKDRMHCESILIPQVFVDGQHIGDAETIERLNESGELRRILKPYKSMDACSTCKVCGGYRLLPCPICNGSKKSVHRNHFTTEFVALKCMNCDEVGLVKCTSC